MGDEKTAQGLFALGIALFLASFLHGGLFGGQHTLTTEKAQEIQQARREFHNLSHQYAHHTAGDNPGLDAGGDPIEIDRSKVEAAEEKFNQLQAEVDAIRNSRPWLTTLLRLGGAGLCLLAGALALASRNKPVSDEIDRASASAISAYESKVNRHS